MDSFNINQFKSLVAEAQEVMTGCPADVPLKQYLQSFLMERVPMMPSTHAEGIVTKLDAGIQEFNVSFQANMLNEDMLDVEKLLQQMSAQEALDVLVNYRTCVRLSTEPGINPTQEHIDEVRATIANCYKPNKESIADLCADLKKDITSMTLNMPNDDFFEKLTSEGFTPNAMGTFLNHQDAALYIAVIAYIHSLSNDSELPMLSQNPHMVGIAVASAVEQARGLLLLSQGSISSRKWQKIAEIAAMVAIISSLSTILAAIPGLPVIVVDIWINAMYWISTISIIINYSADSLNPWQTNKWKLMHEHSTRQLTVYGIMLNKSELSTPSNKIEQGSALLKQPEGTLADEAEAITEKDKKK